MKEDELALQLRLTLLCMYKTKVCPRVLQNRENLIFFVVYDSHRLTLHIADNFLLNSVLQLKCAWFSLANIKIMHESLV